jgi:dipeptidyl aminopeptidase/acylaminoacyl peptidase
MNPKLIASIAILLLLAGVSAFAQSKDDGKTISRTGYIFAPFDRVDGLAKVVSKEEYEKAVGDTRFRMEELKYSSDGLTVSAYLYAPRDTAGKKLPVIVFNRGGYIRGNMGYELAAFFNRLASSGFVVLAPLYRASNGAEGKDEVGGADVNDLMNTLPLLKSLDFADTNNLFMYGESRGGMMTFQAVRNGYPVNAAATYGGFTDFDALVSAQPDLYQPLIKAIWPDYETQKKAIIEKRSAVRWADKLNAPLLLMHGGADKSVDPAQTLNLAQLLQKAGKSYELVIYNGDNHTLNKNQLDRDARAAAWFKKHIK